MLKENVKTKEGMFAGAEGKLRLGAMTAFIISFVCCFLPISFLSHRFGENLFKPYDTVSYLGGTVYNSNIVGNDNMTYTSILTLIALAATVIVSVRKSPLFAIIAGALAMITFVVLLSFVPAVFEPDYLRARWELTVKLGAFAAPTASFIGIVLSLAAVLTKRKLK